MYLLIKNFKCLYLKETVIKLLNKIGTHVPFAKFIDHINIILIRCFSLFFLLSLSLTPPCAPNIVKVSGAPLWRQVSGVWCHHAGQIFSNKDCK